MTNLVTSRLRCEPLSFGHMDGLHVINRDPEVMRFLGGQAQSPEATRAMLGRVEAYWQRHGFGWWAIFEADSGELIGAGGVQHLNKNPAQPLELGWRLRRDRWGRGYASEAARAFAAFAFDQLAAPLVCAICDPANLASRRVMARIGMQYMDERRFQAEPVAYYELARADWTARLYG